MYIRLHSEGMLTDVHNWLRCLFVVSKVCKGNKKKDTSKQAFLFVACNPNRLFTFGNVLNIIKNMENMKKLKLFLVL